jgi:mRNA-degrading endonuclease toxin of MazEF toxin-antitoxin module
MYKRASMNDLLAAALPSNRFLHNPAGDAEGEMVRNKLHRICAMADMMKDLITDEDELPPWVQDHISTAHENIDQVLSYIQPKSEKTAGPRMDAIKDLAAKLQLTASRGGESMATFAGKLARNPVARQAAMGALGGAAVGGLTGGDLEAALVGAALGGAGAGGSKYIKDQRSAAVRRINLANQQGVISQLIPGFQGYRPLSKKDRARAVQAMLDQRSWADKLKMRHQLGELRADRAKALGNIAKQHQYLTPAAALAPAALAGLAMRDSE